MIKIKTDRHKLYESLLELRIGIALLRSIQLPFKLFGCRDEQKRSAKINPTFM